MQKNPFVLFKEAYCKKKTVQVKAEQHFHFLGGGVNFLKKLQSTCTHISSILLLVNSFNHLTCLTELAALVGAESATIHV